MALPAILTALSKMDGCPYDPDAPENQNDDFRNGFRAATENPKSLAGSDNAITLEWQRRGSPMIADDSFRMWKRGYWAARFIAVSQMDDHGQASLTE
jgi:hypothetical protein